MFDLASLPLDKVKDLIAMATKTKPWSLDAVDDLLALIKWGNDQLKSSPTPIGYSSGGPGTVTLVQALLDGAVVQDDDQATDAIGSGILASIAISALIKLALQVLSNNLG